MSSSSILIRMSSGSNPTRSNMVFFYCSFLCALTAHGDGHPDGHEHRMVHAGPAGPQTLYSPPRASPQGGPQAAGPRYAGIDTQPSAENL